MTNTYLFSGEVKTSKREHKASTSGILTTILTTNEYDHVGRLVETKKKVGTQAEISQSKLAYNEIGQLRQKNLHVNGSTVAQEIVYGYNERGWLSKMNNPAAVTAKQVFGMDLSYADKADTYNGNIGTMKWNTKVTTGMTLQPVQTYTYSYDKLNRLSRGSYKNAGAVAVNKEGFYDEELRYDNMGNIDSLRRTSGSKTLSNNFKYTYSGHKLTKVTDAATPARTNSFAYDLNGNATTNTRLGITKIEYNYLNLPVRFIKGVDTLMYKYDGLGQKLSKKLGGAKTDYVNGIQYKNGVIEFIQTEEGRILPNGSSYIYEYFLSDHLGNTRAVVDQSGVIKQIQDYYPFGMEMNQGNSLNAASNLYKYNGKEKQVELKLDQLDYGARFYDAEIGRWNVVDPLAEHMRVFSPYVYGNNNPIRYIDPDGRKGVDWIKWKASTGTTYYTYDRQVTSAAQAKEKGYTNVDWVAESGSIATGSGGSYTMSQGGKFTKEGSEGNIDISGVGAVANGGKVRVNMAKSGLKQSGELLSGVGDGLSYGGMATFQPELVKLGEVIGLPGNLMEKADDIIMNNGSKESIIRNSVSVGMQILFGKLADLGVMGTKKVSGGIDNKISEFIIKNMTGEIGKVYDKAIQEKLKEK